MLKRTLDVVGGVTGILALSWLLIPVGIAIAVTSPGGVFFRQVRVARGGGTFTTEVLGLCRFVPMVRPAG